MININHSIVSRLPFSFLLLIVSSSSFATPNGMDLLLACEHSLAEGFSGTEGMMCNWYATPCDCFHGENSEIPRVCLPPDPDPDVDALPREVTKGLATTPELLDESADVAARG